MMQAVNSVWDEGRTLIEMRSDHLEPYVAKGDVAVVVRSKTWQGPGIYKMRDKQLKKLKEDLETDQIKGKVIGKYTCTMI